MPDLDNLAERIERETHNIDIHIDAMLASLARLRQLNEQVIRDFGEL